MQINCLPLSSKVTKNKVLSNISVILEAEMHFLLFRIWFEKGNKVLR